MSPPFLPSLLVGTKIEKTIDPKEVDQMRKEKQNVLVIHK